jgi:hypothetical protein
MTAVARPPDSIQSRRLKVKKVVLPQLMETWYVFYVTVGRRRPYDGLHGDLEFDIY